MSSSIPSTTCSSPNNDSIESVIKNDSVRYRRKGYGLISAVMITVWCFFISPQIAKGFWEQIRGKWDHRVFYAVSMILIHTGTFIIANVGMWAIYHLKSEFFERYKISNKQWPWEEDIVKWRITVKKTIKNLLFSHLILAPSVLALDCFIGVPLKMDFLTFPSSFEIIKQVLFCMVCEDFAFYWNHRLLHWKRIYPYIHKKHHEYINPISISSEYSHPVEFVIGNMLPTALGAKILGGNIHIFTVWIWTIIRVLETVDGHSGYDFSWSPFRLLPLSGSAGYHNFHHTHNVGNFGSFFMIWDTLMQTNKNYFKHLAKKQKEENLDQIREEYVKAKTKMTADPQAIQAKLSEMTATPQIASDLPNEHKKAD